MNAVAPSPSERNTPVGLLDLLRRLDWRSELLALALVLAETAIVYLICGLFLGDNSDQTRVLPAWIVGMLLFTAHAAPRLLDEWRVWSPEYETITAITIALSTLVAVKFGSFPALPVWDIDWLRQAFRALAFLPNNAARPVWGVVALAAYAWWRGRNRAEPTIDSAYTMLRAGTLALSIAMLLTLIAAPDSAQVRDRLSGATVAFFVCALAAIGVARLKLEGFRTSAPLGPRWLATFVAPILAVVAVAIIGAGVFSRQFLDTILWMLSPVFLVLELVFQAFILIMALIAFLVLTPIVWLIATREPRVVQQTATPSALADQGALERAAGDVFQIPDPLRYLIAAIVLFVVFSALTRFIFRRRRREREATAEERESVLEWGDLFANVGNRIRGLLRRRGPGEDPLGRLRGDPRWRYTLVIRETYLRLQNQGAEAGRPRRAAETADEYRRGVVARFPMPPDAHGAIATITDRYREARYSGVPAGPDAAAEASAAGTRVEQALVQIANERAD